MQAAAFLDLLIKTAWELRSILFICLAVQWLVWWIHGRPFKSEKFFDVTGSLTFIISVLFSYVAPWKNPLSFYSFFWQATGGCGKRPLLISVLVLLWSSRLGLYLFGRITRDKEDRRMTPVKKNEFIWFGTWTLQGSWCFIVGLPAYIVNMNPGATPPLGWYDLLGLSLFFIGWGIECLADLQKDEWRAGTRSSAFNVTMSSDHIKCNRQMEPAENRKAFIYKGLWAWSRHPNYFGEILLWVGISITASNGVPADMACVVWLSPLYTFFLLYFVTGVPLLEKYADEKWGLEPSYQSYKERTNLLFLWPPRREVCHIGTTIVIY